MTTPSQAKGDRFEREVCGYLRDELGTSITRQRTSPTGDRGDLAGIPAFTLELKNHRNLADGINAGLRDLAVEQANAGTPHGAVIVRRHGKPDPADALFCMRLGDAIPILRELGWDIAPAANDERTSA